MPVLKPLHDAATITRVVVSTYQPASGAGTEAVYEPSHQTKGNYVQGNEMEAKKSTKQPPLNTFPPTTHRVSARSKIRAHRHAWGSGMRRRPASPVGA